jgi:hypothetical protein
METAGKAIWDQANIERYWVRKTEVKTKRKKVQKTHRPRIPSPSPIRVGKAGRNHLKEKFNPSSPLG